MSIVLVAVLGALIPTLLYVFLVWWLDRFEKEPFRLLALAFLWGAIPAALLSVLFELIFDLPLGFLGSESLAANLISASVNAPLIEETCKGIALIGMVLIFRREFDSVLDGIVYGAMIGLGFAFTENSIAYFLPVLLEEGIAAGLVNIFLRAIVFGVNHALWTGIVGAAIAYARLSRDRVRRLLVPVGGWLLAVTLHGIHNTGASLVEQTLCLSLLFSAAVDWFSVLVLLIVAILMLQQESQWIERGLVEEVRRGALAEAEFYLLRSARERLRARRRARQRGGRAASRVVGRYFQCATELAFKKQQLRSLGDEGGTLAEIQRLRGELAALQTEAYPWLDLPGA